MSLQQTVNNYPNSVHAKQAKKEIAGFQDWIINNSETLRKRKMTTESINNLIYLVKNFPKHELASKAQYIIGDIYMNDLRDFEIFPRVDVGSFKPLHTNRPQNNIAIIIRTQIPIKPAIKLFWFFKSVSVKSKIKDTFLGSDSMNLDFRARPCRNTMRINIPKLLDLLIFCIYRRGAFTNYVCI